MDKRSQAVVPSDGAQRRVNEHLWRDGDHVGTYANRQLRPVEVVILARFHDALAGRVLELGCGAGRLTGYLLEISPSVHGIDLSSRMIAYCRRRYPKGFFEVRDLRDIEGLGRSSFDVIVAPFNVIDVLNDADRGAALDQIHAALSSNGLFILSTHNRAYAPRLMDPLRGRRLDLPSYLAVVSRLPFWLRNRRRVRRFEHQESGYAVLNDSSVDFIALHYYIERDDQERQLSAHGFSLVECLDLEGRRVEPGEAAPACPELHYVARRVELG